MRESLDDFSRQLEVVGKCFGRQLNPIRNTDDPNSMLLGIRVFLFVDLELEGIAIVLIAIKLNHNYPTTTLVRHIPAPPAVRKLDFSAHPSGFADDFA